jgi:chaperonin GroES
MKKKEANVAKAKKTAQKAAKKPAATKAATKKSPAKKAVAKKTAPKPAPAKKTAAKTSSAPKAAKSVATKPAASANFKWDQFLTPLDDRLIVEATSGEKMTAGGLYIPDTATDTSGNFKGLVLVAGRGHRDAKGKIHPMDVQTGDTVIFSEVSGAKMDLMGKEVRILRESEILGIVTKK